MTSEAPDRVHAASFLTLHYRLTGPDGQVVVDTFGGKPATLTMGTGELSPAVEQRLLGLRAGDERSFDLPPGEAFGAHHPDKVQRVARQLLAQLGDPDEQYRPGDVIQFPSPDGQSRFAGTVRDVPADGQGGVLIDFNHPLAGQGVRFDVRLLGVL